MAGLEKLTVNDFSPNNFTFVQKNDDVIKVKSIHGNYPSVITTKIVFSSVGKYNVSLYLASSFNVYWRGSYNHRHIISLKNGINNFQILITEPGIFNVEIISRNTEGKFYEVSNLSIKKLQNTTNYHNRYGNYKTRRGYENKFTPLRNRITNPPNVTVLLPTLNRYEGFVRVVNDFKSQKFTNFEFIVIDDGSNLQIFNKKKLYIDKLRDPRFKILRNETNIGIANSLNRGIVESYGDYITWVSDDNEYFNNYLSTLYDTNSEFSYSYWQINKRGNQIINKQYNNIYDLLNNFWGLASFMWKRTLIEKIGLYDPNLNGCEDYEYLLRTFLNTTKIEFKKISTMKYYDHKDSTYYKDYKNITSLKNQIIKLYNYIIRINHKDNYFVINSLAPYNESQFNYFLQTNSIDKNNFNVYVVSNNEDIILFNEEYEVLIISNKFENIVNNICKNKLKILLASEKINESQDFDASPQIYSLTNIQETNLGDKKISIVMSYINRKKQVEFTLKTINYSKHKNIEIIIWDDGSDPDQQLDDFVEKYGIKLLKSSMNKDWNNPVVGYNNAIMQATGDIVIIQNPEVCYLDDIIYYVANGLRQNEYISFSCYSLANINENDKLYNLLDTYENYQQNYNKIISIIKNDTTIAGNTIHNEPKNGWVNHPVYLPVGYHYLCALHRDSLLELGGFDTDYKFGFCHDDDDFVRRIKKNNLLSSISEKYCIHQWHPSQIKVIDAPELWKINQKIFWNKMSSYNIGETFDTDLIHSLFKNKDNWPSKIPKILHLYWNGDQFTILHLLTVKSFMLYNPDWRVKVYTPLLTTNIINPTWKSTEQKYVYNGYNYLEELKKLDIDYITIDFDQIGFFNNANDVYKSDFLRWYLLYNFGGVWSDFDVLYIKNLNEKLFENSQRNCEIKNIEQAIYFFDGVFPIGFLMSSKNNIFFKECYENSLKYYNTDNYQSIGACMWFSLFKNGDNVLKNFPNTSILSESTIYPYKWNKISEFFNTDNIIQNENNYMKLISGDTIGIHWFNGAEVGKKFCSSIINVQECSIICKLLRKMENIKWRLKFINFNNFSFIPLHQLRSENTTKNSTHLRALKDFSEENNYSGFNINGDIIINEPYQLVSCINILNDWNGCYINNNIYPKISIISICDCSKIQTILSLKSIERSKYKNVEVILLDLNNNNWDDIISEFPFIIKIKSIKEITSNPGKYYNIGLQYSNGEVIIFQNSSIYHASDILSYTIENLTINNYLSFSCLALVNDDMNMNLSSLHYKNNNVANILSNIETFSNNNGLVWLSNPSLSINTSPIFALHRKNVDKIRGFDTQYFNGYGFYDEDLFAKLKYNLGINIQVSDPTNYLTVKQYNSNPVVIDHFEINNTTPKPQQWLINQNIYENKLEQLKQLSSLKVPKIFNCFIPQKIISYLKYLTIRSFIYYNPDWIINIYTPDVLLSDNNNYVGKNYWSNLTRLNNINITSVNLQEIGLTNDTPLNVLEDYIKFHILSTTGGLWSDMDVIYLNSVLNTIFVQNPNFDTFIGNSNNEFSTKLLISKPNNLLFANMKQLVKNNYNSNNKSYDIINVYKLLDNPQEINRQFPNINLLTSQNLFVPLNYNEIYDSVNTNKNITNGTLLLKWYQNNKLSIELENNINQSTNNNIIVNLIKRFNKLLENDNYNINIIPLY
uniref:Glycosyltransferase GTa type n=1 Tax=Borely moumouvirus TaxID=2712067 RepID=A0A6G6ACX1_9VIRU